MAKSLLIAGCVNYVTSTANTTQYWNPYGYADKSATEAYRTHSVYEDGTLSNLSIKLAAYGISGTTVFRLRINGADANQSISVASLGTGEFEDASGTDDVNWSDDLTIRSVPGASSGTFSVYYMSMLFTPESDTAEKCYSHFSWSHPTGRSGLTGASTAYYQGLNGYFETANTNEGNVEHRIEYAGYMTGLACRVANNTRGSDTVVSMRVNWATWPENPQLTIPANTSGWFGDESTYDNFNDGDRLNYRILNGTGTNSIDWLYITCALVVTDDTRKSTIIGANQLAPTQSRNLTRYYAFSGYFDMMTNEGAPQYRIPVGEWTAKNMNVKIRSNGLNNTSTWKLRKNGADTSLSVSITTGATGFFEDTSNTVTLVEDDLVCYQMITVGSGSQSLAVSSYGVVLEATAEFREILAGFTNSITLTHDSTNRLRQLNQLRTDSIVLTDAGRTRIKSLNRSRTDSLSLIHSSTNSFRMLVQILTDNNIVLSLSSINKLRGKTRGIAESIDNITDSISRTKVLVVRTFTNSITLTHVSNEAFANLSRNIISESLGSFNSTVGRLRNKIKSTNQSILYFWRYDEGLEDWVEGIDMFRFVGKVKSLPSDINIGLSDVNNKLANKIRTTGTHSIELTIASLTAIKEKLRSLPEQTISFSTGSFTRLLAKIGIITDNNITLSLESISRLTNRLRELSSEITFIEETISQTRNKLAGFTDSLSSLSDSTTRLTDKIKIFTNNIEFDSVVIDRLKGITRSVEQQDITLQHQFHRLLSRVRTLSEDISLNSEISTSRLKIKAFSDNLNLVSNTVIFLRNKIAGFTQNLTTEQIINRLTARLRSLDNLNLTFESDVGFGGAVTKVFDEVLNISESVSRFKAISKTFSESLGFTDLVNSFRTLVVYIDDNNLNFVDSLSQLKLLLKGFTNSLALTDTHNRLQNKLRDYSEAGSLGFSDVISRLKLGVSRSISAQNIGPLAVASINTAKGIGRGFTESLSLLAENMTHVKLLRIRALPSHNLGLSSINFKLRDKIKSTSTQNLNLNDSLINRARLRLKAFGESLAFSNVVIEYAKEMLTRNITDSIAFTSSKTTDITGKVKAFASSIHISDSISQTYSAYIAPVVLSLGVKLRRPELLTRAYEFGVNSLGNRILMRNSHPYIKRKDIETPKPRRQTTTTTTTTTTEIDINKKQTGGGGGNNDDLKSQANKGKKLNKYF